MLSVIPSWMLDKVMGGQKQASAGQAYSKALEAGLEYGGYAVSFPLEANTDARARDSSGPSF